MIKKLLLLLSFICLQKQSFAQAGAFDLTFANAGIGTYMPGTINDLGYSIAGLQDSSMYVLSAARINNITSSVVMHIKENGTIDSSFGDAGRAIMQYGTSIYMYSMALQTDGKILATGLSYVTVSDANFITCRINTNGTIDSTFGNNGYAEYGFGTNEDATNAVKVLSDGSILVAGYSRQPNKRSTIVKYTTDGVVDSTFGVNGVVIITNSGGSTDQLTSIDQLADGTIVAAGYKTSSAGGNSAIAFRIDNLGNPLGGVLSLSSGSDSRASAILSDGYQYYVVGNNSTATFITKLDTLGVIPTSFNNGNYASLNGGGAITYLAGIARQWDGKIVVCGSSGQTNFTRGWIVARYNSNGLIDPTFGTNGKVIHTFGANVFADAYGVCLFSNGKVGVTGFRSSLGGSANDCIVMRLLNDSMCITPNTPPTLTGQLLNVCGKTLSYTIPAVANADNYTWRASNPNVLINGAPGPFTDTVLTVNVTWPSNLTSNTTLYVKANNGCGSSVEKTGLAIVYPIAINAINGNNLNVFGQTINYSINASQGATTYTWTTNVSGAQINSNQGTTYTSADTSINVTWPSGFTNGILYVQASNDCGNSPVYTINLLGTIGLNELNSSSIVVYPNPVNVNSLVTIQAEITGESALQIIDLTGKLILNTFVEFKNNKAELNLEGLTKGTYLIKLINDDELLTKKITIQ
jgi:uncharacterized delta-60 repeat protein